MGIPHLEGPQPISHPTKTQIGSHALIWLRRILELEHFQNTDAPGTRAVHPSHSKYEPLWSTSTSETKSSSLLIILLGHFVRSARFMVCNFKTPQPPSLSGLHTWSQGTGAKPLPSLDPKPFQKNLLIKPSSSSSTPASYFKTK